MAIVLQRYNLFLIILVSLEKVLTVFWRTFLLFIQFATQPTSSAIAKTRLDY